MSKQSKVLFITAPIGSGHIRAAQAISKAVREQNSQVETFVANIFDFISPSIGSVILRFYLKVLKYFPKAYGMAYGWGNSNKLALLGREYINSYMAEKISNFIEKYSPSVIVCTHATPAGMIAQLVKKQRINIPSYAVVTDFTIHRLWIYPELDCYFVANLGIQSILSKHGIPKHKSVTVGIPIDLAFNSSTDRNCILKVLNLKEDTKTIMIMGGGAGVLPLDKIALACDDISADLQIVVVTGNNEAIYKKMVDLKPKFRHSLTVLGFINNVHELMAVADVLISKPGGMTSAEALCRGLPMIIYKPIPGQEEVNTRYLVEQAVALRADSLEQVKELLETVIMKQPELLNTLRQKALSIGNPNASNIIASHILASL